MSFTNLTSVSRNVLFSAALILLFSSALTAQQNSPRGAVGAQKIRDWNTRILQLQERLENSPALARLAVRLEATPIFQQRLAAMAALVDEDPQAVLDTAFSAPMLRTLSEAFPEAVLEEEGEFTGLAEHVVADDHTMSEGTSHIRMQSGKEWLRVSFAGPAPDVQCSQNLRVRGVRVGGAVAAADGATSSAGGPVSTCATTGQQYIAVLLVTFPGVAAPSNVTPDLVDKIFFQANGRSVDTYWREASQGKTSASGKVFGWYTLDAAYSCSQYYQMRDAAIRAADKDVDFRSFNRVMIVFPQPSGCGWAGLGTLGCSYLTSPNDGNFTASTAWLAATYMSSIDNGVKLATHEGGHNLGLNHARTYDFGSVPLGAIGATPSVSEYGDVFSTMGSWNLGHYSAANKVRLKWFDTTTQAPTVTTGGVYDLIPFASATPGRQALKIQRGAGNNAWLWLEYRQPLGIFESTLASQIHSGASLRYEESATAYTNLLDFTPETSSWSDPALTVGKTWTDPYSNLSILVQSATASGLAVNISYGSAPCVRNAPTLAVSPANPSGNAGSKLNYTVTVSNKDSSGCPAATFVPASSLPSGWTTTYSTSGLTVDPGASGEFTMSKTIPAGTATATYPADVSVSDADHSAVTTTASATVTVVCVYAPPTLSVSPASQSGAPGTALNYTVNVVNNDSASCPSATLAPSSNTPAGWVTSFSTSGLKLAPGASGDFTMSKTIPAGLAAKTYPLSVNVSDNNHNQGTSASAVVTAASNCAYAAPTISISPSSQSGAPGAQLSYSVTVVNNDSATCTAATLTPSSATPSGWTSAYSPSSLTLEPGASANFTFTKTIPANAAANTYPVGLNLSDANHNQGASASATVTSGSSCSYAAPTLTVSPANQSGASGTQITYTVTVLNNDSSSCAAAKFAPSTALPSGWTTSFSTSLLTLAPGASGNFTMTKTIPANAVANTYKVSVNVSDNNHNQGSSATATVTPAATCNHAAPSVTLSPANLSGAAGTQLVYTITVVNNDSSTCTASTLVPSSTQPAGWITAYSTSGLKLDPGASGNFTMTKSIPAGTAANTYPVSLNVSDNNHNQGASATATVTSTSAPCSYKPPTVTLSPSSQSGAPGKQLAYTVTVVNNDTSACNPAKFAPSTALPSGWTTSFSTSLLTLAPGGSGNFTMTKTIPANAPANTYSVSVNVSDNNHNQGTAGSATVTGSACTYATPTVTVAPASQSGAPGSKLNYSVTVLNKDSSSCPAATFAPSSALPSSWTTSFSTSGLTLAPGASGNFTMTKTIPANAAANTYGVTATVGDANHSQSATASATVTSSCLRAAPGVTISPASQSGAPGTSLNYTVTVANKDTAACAASTFAPSSTLPSGWTTSFSTSGLNIAPGASANFTMTKTIPAGTAANTYAVNVNVSDANHNQGASASATVTGTVSSLAVTLSTPGGALALDDYTTLTATVLSGGSPVAGASVGFSVKQPNGSTSVTVSTTNASGVATRVVRATQSGAWSATANVFYSGKSAVSNPVSWSAY